MALRKPLFMSAEGYSEEMAATDSLALGGLAMSGAITMGTNKITGAGAATASGDVLVYGQSGGSLSGLSITTNPLNMNNQLINNVLAPVSGGDAVNKTYVDQLTISGGKLKEALLYQPQLSDSLGILSAGALVIATNPISGDTVTLSDGVTTRTYGAGTGGDVQYTIGGTVAITMQNLVDAINGDGSAIWGAYFTTNLDEINASGVVIIFEDSNAGAASKVYGVWGTPADCKIVDFTGDLNYDDKVLVNLPAPTPASSNFGIRRVQASLADGELHYIFESDDMYSWDDGANIWNTMSGGGSIPDATSASGGGIKGKVTFDSDFGLTVGSGIAKIDLSTTPGLQFLTGKLAVKHNANAGLDVTASGVEIDLAASNPGLQFDGSGDLQVKHNANAGLDVTSNGIEIDLGATNPGLEFDGSGDLQAKVYANGGVQKTANGLELLLDNTPDTLDVDADGLKVVGLPSLFKINDVAVGVTVTAANLDDLTDGSNADSLHSHSSSTASNFIENDLAVDEAISVADPVYITATGNRVGVARADTAAKARVIGVAKTAQATPGSDATIISDGLCSGIISGATPGTPYYLGDSGSISTSLPSAGGRVIQCGMALSATDFWVRLMDFGKLAS